MIINGRHDVIGSHTMEVTDILSDDIRRQKTIVLTKIRDNNKIAHSVVTTQNSLSLPHSDLLALRFRPH